jgi:outer membrane lipoprotein SlyB
MERVKPMKLLLVVLAAATLAGCASRESANVYKSSEAQREQSVRFGTVESVREVQIQGQRSQVGTVGGGVVGGIAGSTVGHGRGSAVGAVLGGIAGGVAGTAIEEGVTRKTGLEITVKLDNGDFRAIVQEADTPFKPGQRVRLVSSGGVTRVTP